MSDFGRLEKIDLREGWASEAGDFTPWLGEGNNLALLGGTLGLELELVEQERPVGPYRADVVCQDTDTGSLVLIENQLEKTDHTHLGQLLTYAAGLQAVTIVWIASRFTDEHRAALDWLNDHTGDAIQIFGLEIELWKIAASPPAPKFNVVAKPNEWVKSGAGGLKAGLSDTRQSQLEYWTAFKTFTEDGGSNLFATTKPSPVGWFSSRPYGNRGVVLNAVFGAKKRIRAELYLKGRDAKQLFDWLSNYKEEIETALGKPLIWQRLENKKVSRIKFELEDADWKDQSDRSRQFQWLLEHLEQLVPVFDPLITQADSELNSPSEE